MLSHQDSPDPLKAADICNGGVFSNNLPPLERLLLPNRTCLFTWSRTAINASLALRRRLRGISVMPVRRSHSAPPWSMRNVQYRLGPGDCRGGPYCMSYGGDQPHVEYCERKVQAVGVGTVRNLASTSVRSTHGRAGTRRSRPPATSHPSSRGLRPSPGRSRFLRPPSRFDADAVPRSYTHPRRSHTAVTAHNAEPGRRDEERKKPGREPTSSPRRTLRLKTQPMSMRNRAALPLSVSW